MLSPIELDMLIRKIKKSNNQDIVNNVMSGIDDLIAAIEHYQQLLRDIVHITEEIEFKRKNKSFIEWEKDTYVRYAYGTHPTYDSVIGNNSVIGMQYD